MRVNDTVEAITQKKETEESPFVFLTVYSPVSLRNTISPAVRAELIPRTIVPSELPQSVAGKHTSVHAFSVLSGTVSNTADLAQHPATVPRLPWTVFASTSLPESPHLTSDTLSLRGKINSVCT